MTWEADAGLAGAERTRASNLNRLSATFPRSRNGNFACDFVHHAPRTSRTYTEGDPPADLAMPDRPRLSACIITLNEADRIGACLASLAFCDEIVLVDSGSTDGTREIASDAGARVVENAFDGYRAQKDFAVKQARNDWVLCLDADERVTPQLRASIEAARDGGFAGTAGYRFA